jgi:DNA-binding YbaB/EbfC family protein
MTKRHSGGFGGPMMPGNPGAMRQLQKMQEDLVKAQEALAAETVEVEAGGGAIKIVITGNQHVKSVTIKPETLDTSDPEWTNDLQDLLVVAFNQAIEKSQALASERMNAATGGLSGMLPPGLF